MEKRWVIDVSKYPGCPDERCGEFRWMWCAWLAGWVMAAFGPWSYVKVRRLP